LPPGNFVCHLFADFRRVILNSAITMVFEGAFCCRLLLPRKFFSAADCTFLFFSFLDYSTNVPYSKFE